MLWSGTYYDTEARAKTGFRRGQKNLVEFMAWVDYSALLGLTFFDCEVKRLEQFRVFKAMLR